MIIILYVMDSLRPDFLSCYGYQRETSPNIDALALDGVLFTEAFAQATWTRPSGASLLTSLYPGVHGVLGLNSVLSDDVPLLPEVLRQQGFSTMAISSIGNISPDFGFGRGFETFIELYKDEKVIEKRSKFEFERTGWDRRDFKVETDYVAVASSEDINEAIFPVLEKLGNRDLFILAWSIDTHDPYYHRDPRMARFCSSHDLWFYKDVKGVQTEEERDQLKQLYEDMIYYNDHFIGQLIRRLRDLKLMDQTLFILTGDHGEFFGEHGLNSHAGIPYDEVIRVPLIVRFPQAEFHGVASGLVQHIDVAPTILDYLKLPTRPEGLQGKSLLPLLREQVHVNEWTLAEYHLREELPKYVALRSIDYKYIEIFPGKLGLRPSLHELSQRLVWLFAKPRMLFSLADDPGERSNITRLRPEVVRELHGRVKQTLLENKRRSRSLKRKTKERVDVDKDVARQLKGLGYFE